MGSAFPTLSLFALLALAFGTLAPRVLQPLVGVLLAMVGVGLAQPEPARSEMVQRWLETRYDKSGLDTLSDPQGIIVAGGGLATYFVDRDMKLSLDERGRSGRITGAAALARRYPNAKVIHAGLEQESPGDAFAQLGVARERMIVEDRSRTTYENAAFSAALLKPRPDQRWILVTSASHMPRAIATFRTAGFDVVAYPVDFEADPEHAPQDAARRAAKSGWPRGRREMLAMLGYVATGRISLWHWQALVIGARR